jgi:protein-S-isoprenylcysteine O-methyltransferase Ste14
MSESGLNWSRIARRIRVPLGFVFAIVFFWLARPALWSIVAGACVVALGVWIRAIASGHVDKNAALAMSGPYAYTRNPLYLGSIVIAIGFAIAALSIWIALILLLMFVGIYVPVIRSEEAFLKSKFPEYRAYSERVPRLIPRLRSANANTGSFSRELYLKHREYNALAGSAAMLAALVLKFFYLRG